MGVGVGVGVCVYTEKSSAVFAQSGTFWGWFNGTGGNSGVESAYFFLLGSSTSLLYILLRSISFIILINH